MYDISQRSIRKVKTKEHNICFVNETGIIDSGRFVFDTMGVICFQEPTNGCSSWGAISILNFCATKISCV